VSHSIRHLISGALIIAAPQVAAMAQLRPTGLPGAGVPASSRITAKPTGVIDGAVTDSTLAPVPMAEVSVLRTSLRLYTNRQGSFQIVDVPAGQYILIVRRIGFGPVSQVIDVSERDTLRLAYELTRIPRTSLDTVRVMAERTSRDLQEFEQRRLHGVGEFLTREQIARRGSLELSALMRGFRSVSIASDPSKGGAIPDIIAYNKRDYGNFLTPGAGACPMQVVVDGVNMPSAFDLNLGPLISQIAGIEVYGGPSEAPAQFQGTDRRCGLILIWTRVGK
jgi:hypothetical protein